MVAVQSDEFWDLLGSFGPGSLVADCSLGLRSRPIIPIVNRSACEISALAQADWLAYARGRQLDAVLTFVDEFRQRYLALKGLLRASVHASDIAEVTTGLTDRWREDCGVEPRVIALKICPISAELWCLAGGRKRVAWRFEAGMLTETTAGSS